jgi:oxygen-dependent protoporphyrinogen oxidase
LRGNSKHRVAIIGGGLSGLATAVKLHLADAAIELTLFEASDHPGGVIGTEHAGGFLIDHGADMFSTKPSAALDLCRELGLEHRLIEPQPTGRGALIVRQGKLLPIPSGFVLMRATRLLPMLTTPLLSWRGKLRFLAERWIRRRPAAEGDDESVSDFVTRRMGKEVLDRIVAPLSAGIYTADIRKLSMRATMGPIAKMEQEYGSLARASRARRRSGEDVLERGSVGARYGQFRAFQGGMTELIEGLVAALPVDTIRLSSEVRSLRRQETSWLLATDDDQQHEFDHVVVAAGPRPAAALLQEITPAAASELESIESTSTAIVVLGVRRADVQRDLQAFGLVVPLTEGRQILAASFASQKFAGRAPDDQMLVRVFIGGAMQSELLDQSDQQLVEIARRELGELIGLSGEPVIAKVVRWNHSMPQYHVGHVARVDRITRGLAEVPALSLVNNALHGVGIAPVIQLADRTSQQIVSSFTPSGDVATSRRVQA